MPAPPMLAADVAPVGRARRAQVVATATTTLTGVGAALLAGRTVGLHLPPCPFRTLTGVPCPGCGMTRLADALVHGRIGSSLASDPGAVLLLGVIAVLAVASTSARLRGRRTPAWLGATPVLVAIVVLAGVHWATTLVTGLP